MYLKKIHDDPQRLASDRPKRHPNPRQPLDRGREDTERYSPRQEDDSRQD